MEKIYIQENGLFMNFGIDDNNELRLFSLSVYPGAEEMGEPQDGRLFAATEILVTGDTVVGYGNRHHGSGDLDRLKYVSHTDTRLDGGRLLDFTLKDSKMTVHQYYRFYDGAKVISAWVTIENTSDHDIGLEYVASFCLGGIGRVGQQSMADKLELYIPHNGWCNELHWTHDTLRNCGFNPIQRESTSRISVSNTGAWSTKEQLPMAMLHDTENNETILWQIEHNGSWNWELFDCYDTALLRLSGPSEVENGWWKNLKPGESFTGVPVSVAVAAGDFGSAVREITKYRRVVSADRLDPELPVYFNDYLFCLWADPTTEKELPLIKKAAELGAEYYMVDGGWYGTGNWWPTVGEWQESRERFPNGIKEVFDSIRAHGMKPGIWLEPEVMGVNCPLVPEFEDCFFKRHGVKVNNRGRYQLDFRKQKTLDHLNAVIDRFVHEYGIKHIKLDYNIDPGVGTEVDADSFGDGLMEHNRAFLGWIDSIHEKYPDLILENCSSGALRMDQESLKHFSMESISDASFYNEYANKNVMAPTACLPEQTGFWVVPLVEQSAGENAFGAVNAMLHRMYISGETGNLDAAQFAQLKRAVEVYKSIRGDIVGSMPYFPCGVSRNKDVWYVSARVSGGEDRLYLTAGRLEGGESTKQIDLSEFSGRLGKAEILFSVDGEIHLSGDTLEVTLPEKSAMLIRVELIG